MEYSMQNESQHLYQQYQQYEAEVKEEIIDQQYFAQQQTVHNNMDYQQQQYQQQHVDQRKQSNPQQMERLAAKKVGWRLKNFLKLPKAHKLCVYEWFYSDIDDVLFNGNSDFCLCLKDSFPNLKLSNLTRTHWSKIRRMMGKPRRCSEAFFAEERQAIANKRNKIRAFQQNKIPNEDHDTWSLPREIPLPLVVGTHVTAWLHDGINDGLYTGQVEAIDNKKFTYRITFDRPGVGTLQIPDTEVRSFETPEMMNIPSIMEQHNSLQTSQTQFEFPVSQLHHVNKNQDQMLGLSPLRNRIKQETGGNWGGFPVDFLRKTVGLSNVLTLKREKIKLLGEMNSEAEKISTYSQVPYSLKFQRDYAKLIMDLSAINKYLNELLLGVQGYCNELYPEQQVLPMDQTNNIKKECDQAAKEIVDSKRKETKSQLHELIQGLCSVMLHVDLVRDKNHYHMKALDDKIKELKGCVSEENQKCFQSNVEVHLAHVKSTLEQDSYVSMNTK